MASLTQQRLWLVLSILLMARASSSADDAGGGRQEGWKKRRLEKMEQSEPYTISPMERKFLWLENELGEPVPSTALEPIEESLQLVNENLGDLVFPDYRDRLFARVGSVRSGGGFSGGLRFVKLGVPHRTIDLDAAANVSVGGYQFYRVRFGNLLPVLAPTALLGPMLDHGLERWFAYADVRYHDFREESWFVPRDVDDDESIEAEFRHRRAGYGAIVGYRLGAHNIASARAGLSRHRVTPSQESSPESLAQPTISTDFREVAASVQLDYRDVPGNPRRGALLDMFVARFDDTGTDPFHFTRFGVEAQGFVPLGSPQRTLAIRGLLSSDRADEGAAVPFFLQRTLGGNSTLRGFDNFRFRGENLMHLTAEYRWNPSLFWGFSVFWDTGKAFRSFEEEFNLDDLERSFGVGTRLQTLESTILRIQVARSREGTRFHIAVGMVF